jgi:endoglucanase
MTRRGLLLRFALLWAVLIPGAACAQNRIEPSSTPVGQHGALRVQGNRIVDQKGEPVVLRGMSLFWAQWMPQFYNKDAVRWLRKDWNVNIIRAAIPPEPGGYNKHRDREMKKLEQVIDAAIEQGIYVIVDWHAHEPSTKSAIDFFDKVSRKYGNYPNVIYEPWNEPLPKHGWKKHIKPHNEAVTAAIRANDPDNLIVAGTGHWSQDVFLPFFTTKARGTGVGLSLARQIVLAHGGSINVERSEAGGALFSIVI